MTGLEAVLTEIDAVGRDLNRRRFLKSVAGMLVVPAGSLDDEDERFFRRVTAALVPAGLLAQTGIDPVENLRRLLQRTHADHRQRIGRLITIVRRLSYLYGGDRVVIRGRTSRFVLMQKASRALASLCLLCVWGDPRSFALVDNPEPLA